MIGKLVAAPPAPPVLKSWILFLLVSAAMAGCASPSEVVEHPVDTPAPPLKPGVYPVAAVDVAPVSTREVEPDYPPELGGILVGKAVVVFTVRTDGKVRDEAVVKADDALYGEAALAAVVKWRFHPARLHGAPVDCRMTQTFVFTSPYGYIPDEGWAPNPSSPPSDYRRTSVVPH
jgi:TonB family protein